MPETKKDIKADAAVAEATPAKKASKAVIEKADAVAYIGPTISRVAVSGSIYKAGLPRKLEEKIKEIPAIGELIVPVSRLGAARKQVRDRSSSLATVYRYVEQAMTR